jgi:hypothetical protein
MSNELTSHEPPAKLPTAAHVFCGWQLSLLLLGGMVGAIFGMLAYSINLKIYKSDRTLADKVFLIIATGIAAFVLWFAVGLLGQSGINALRHSTGR